MSVKYVLGRGSNLLNPLPIATRPRCPTCGSHIQGKTLKEELQKISDKLVKDARKNLRRLLSEALREK